jgi:alpha-L-rhamnosidase
MMSSRRSASRLSRRTVLALLGAALAPGVAADAAKEAIFLDTSAPEPLHPIWLPEAVEARSNLSKAHWIWFPEGRPEADAPPGVRYFRRSFPIPSDRAVTSAWIEIKADNAYALSVNGAPVGQGDNFHDDDRWNIAPMLRAGGNALTVEATNGGSAPNPAGLIAALVVTFASGDPLSIVTDADWRVTDAPVTGWEKASFDDRGATAARALGAYGMAPWGVGVGRKTDVYAAFRGTFVLPKAAEVSLDIFGAHWFVAMLDGAFLTEGPYRFPIGHAEYEALTVALPAGRHVLAAMVRDEGVVTRMLHGDAIPPFFLGRGHANSRPLPIAWKAMRLPGFVATGQRVNPQFAWVEWEDTRQNPAGWEQPAFDDRAWPVPVAVPGVADWPMRPVSIGRVQHLPVVPRLIGEGTLSGPFDGAEKPDWKTDTDLTWYRRNLKPAGAPTGVWRRFDTGRIHLGRPELTLDLPQGAVVEIAYAESLTGGVVSPFIPLSAGLSRNLDHFVARGGVQTFTPLVPKGGRYFEVHIQSDPRAVKVVREAFFQRTYFGEPVGSFQSGDVRLNDIWALGVHTLQGCSEDAVIDNPTRERGQWTGDVLTALSIAASAYNDVRLFKRAIQQAAYCANPAGLVAGLCPGGESYLPPYSAQWLNATLEYYDLTGDREILTEMYPYASRNIAAFTGALGPNGVKNSLGWAFVDWGYPGTPDSDADVALNLHVLHGARGMRRWSALLNEDPAPADRLAAAIEAAVRRYLDPLVTASDWDTVGYHRAVLALREGLIPDGKRAEAVAYTKRHILACFPNDPHAPRLANPSVHSTQLITPYFANFAFPVLIAAGEADFVREQYRICWGWGLDNGLTTQPEVFDMGWSHCHVWASSPTSQMTTCLLGLRPRFSAGPDHFELTLAAGTLPGASGRVPFPNGVGAVAAEWAAKGETVEYKIQSPRPIGVAVGTDIVAVRSRATLHLARAGAAWKLLGHNDG